MKTIEDFPFETEEIAHFWIPMRDGTRLAARMWLPVDAKRQPVPAILEYIPYRKRDFTADRDEVMHPYFAGHGYAAVRVDLRGSGDSEGVLEDEYLPLELQDGFDVIEWLAKQDWCDGNVGMIGISWGGFNGLQIAAMQPEPLKAIVTVCSTDDRYSDDVHYMGGCLLGDNLSWASTMFAYNSCPPDPDNVGDAWREMWHQRLEGSGLWLDTWLRHQKRVEYWRHGSVCEHYADIRCAVMAVSGWADGYSNAVFRLMENLSCPRRGLLGPWSHKYPHIGVPGPAIGFLQECVHWWDRWLKGNGKKGDHDSEDQPLLQCWMQDSVPPHTSYRLRPGHWVGLTSWPAASVEPDIYRFGKKILRKEHEPEACAPDAKLYLQSPLTVGLYAGKWCSYAATPDLPHDQREEDGGSLTFDSSPLQEDLEILGSPQVTLSFTSDKPQAMVAVRLSDIAPNNQATRITYGLLNLSHRNSHEHPESLEPGKRYEVTVELNAIAQRIPAGHWLRVAVSTSYFPLAWPAPVSARLTIYPHDCRLELPQHFPGPVDKAVEFLEPEGAKPSPEVQLTETNHNWLINRDLARDTCELEVIKDQGYWYRENVDLTLQNKALESYSFTRDDYDTVRGETYWERTFARDGWHIHTKTRTVLTSDAEYFYLRAELDAYENETRVKSMNWDCCIPRDHL